MQHIQGVARSQISFGSLEDRISLDNPVRFVDVFAAKLDLTKIGFSTKLLQKQGRPNFESSLFVRLYLYGYLNGIRSGRKLEKECGRNTENTARRNAKNAQPETFVPREHQEEEKLTEVSMPRQ